MLESELIQLATVIRTKVQERKEAKSVVTSRFVRVRRRNFGLKYHDDFGFANFTPERTEEDIWDTQDHERFQQSQVKTLEEYKLLLSNGMNPSLLEGFARAMALASFHGLTDQELMERATALGRELEGQPLPVTVTAFIDGVAITESPLVITDRFILRRPTPDDVAENIVLDEYGGFSFPLPDVSFRVIGEFTFDAVMTGTAQTEFLRVIEALRLFRVGGIQANRYGMRSCHSYMQGGGMISGGGGRRSQFSYTVSNSNIPALRTFLYDIAPLLPDPFEIEKGTTEREIAFTRYRDALFQAGPSEHAITSAITALEALFLTAEPELTHRLAQRVSVFLRALGTHVDSQTTYQNVADGYKIRSKFIHGGSLKVKERPQADTLAPILLEYTRECVLAFFQVAAPKKEILKQLDLSMIDPPIGQVALNGSLATIKHR